MGAVYGSNRHRTGKCDAIRREYARFVVKLQQRGGGSSIIIHRSVSNAECVYFLRPQIADQRGIKISGKSRIGESLSIAISRVAAAGIENVLVTNRQWPVQIRVSKAVIGLHNSNIVRSQACDLKYRSVIDRHHHVQLSRLARDAPEPIRDFNRIKPSIQRLHIVNCESTIRGAGNALAIEPPIIVHRRRCVDRYAECYVCACKSRLARRIRNDLWNRVHRKQRLPAGGQAQQVAHLHAVVCLVGFRDIRHAQNRVRRSLNRVAVLKPLVRKRRISGGLDRKSHIAGGIGKLACRLNRDRRITRILHETRFCRANRFIPRAKKCRSLHMGIPAAARG